MFAQQCRYPKTEKYIKNNKNNNTTTSYLCKIKVHVKVGVEVLGQSSCGKISINVINRCSRKWWWWWW